MPPVDCSAAAECADVNREPCSLNTPENSCGPCFSGHLGTPGYGTDLCICKGMHVCCSYVRTSTVMCSPSSCNFLEYILSIGQNVLVHHVKFKNLLLVPSASEATHAAPSQHTVNPTGV